MNNFKKISSKYKTNTESEFEPGSKKRILKNKLGIKKKLELDRIEIEAYMKAENYLIRNYNKDHRFSSKDIHLINRVFLGEIYEWAGKLRDVNVSKVNFMFASAFALPELMKEFEKNVLYINTPCQGDLNSIALKIAEVHTELLLLHPYRDGNGRTARLLATIMSYQAGFPGIDFSFIGGKGKEFNKYIRAVQNGMEKNYALMEDIMKRGIKLSLRKFEKT